MSSRAKRRRVGKQSGGDYTVPPLLQGQSTSVQTSSSSLSPSQQCNQTSSNQPPGEPTSNQQPNSSDIPTPSGDNINDIGETLILQSPNHILSKTSTSQPGADTNIAESFIRLMTEMVRELDQLKFGDPVSYIYNPVVYAKETHDCFVRKYGNSSKSVLFLGMNPGPWGMAQNGVPFGETNFVKDWMKITGNVGKPPREHPKREIVGLDCKRSEVSGTRFWGLWKELCGTPENFFRECFVYNHCPLVFMMSTAKNITPPTLKAHMRDPLISICDDYLCKLIKMLGVEVVVGIGKFAEERTKKALAKGGVEGIRVVSLMHPSPINPAANKGWDRIAKQSLQDLDLMKYLKY